MATGEDQSRVKRHVPTSVLSGRQLRPVLTLNCAENPKEWKLFSSQQEKISFS